MTPDDAAGLLTALLIAKASSVSLSEIVRFTRSHLRDFRSYEPRSDHLLFETWHRRLALPLLCHLRKGHTFGDALGALLRSIMQGDLEHAIREWAAARPHGTAPYFRFAVKVNGPRPHSEAQIDFNTAAFDESLVYLRPQDVKGYKLVVPDAPRKFRHITDQHPGYDLIVTASIEQETLTAIGRLLGETA